MEVQTDEEKLRAKHIHAIQQEEFSVVQHSWRPSVAKKPTTFTCYPSPRLAAWAQKQKERSLGSQRQHKWGISNKRRHFHQRIYQCTRRETQDPLLNPHIPPTAAAADWVMLPGGQQKCWLWRISAMFTGVGAPAAGWLPALMGERGGGLIYFFPNHWHRLAHPSCCRRARGNKPPKNGYGGKFPPLWGGGLKKQGADGERERENGGREGLFSTLSQRCPAPNQTSIQHCCSRCDPYQRPPDD